MARGIKPGARQTTLDLTAEQRLILETLGNGNLNQGGKIAIYVFINQLPRLFH